MAQPLFEPYEPRGIYPVFADCENRLNYILRETYIATPWAALRHAGGRLVRRDTSATPGLLARVVLDSIRGIRLRFRGAFLDRNGKLIVEFPPFATVRHLDGFDISINDLLAARGVPLQDGQFLLMADRGVKLDGGYSIGTVGAVYRSSRTFTCYRNGAFARPMNELSHHKPRGFRSIAPHMIANDNSEASIYLFNFSSDPAYAKTASPKVRLYRRHDEYLEGQFGDIPPLGAAERSLSDMFGPSVRAFLAEGDGMGTLIAEESGLTLGSIHLIRNRAAGAMSIEHTRPTQLYVL